MQVAMTEEEAKAEKARESQIMADYAEKRLSIVAKLKADMNARLKRERTIRAMKSNAKRKAQKQARKVQRRA